MFSGDVVVANGADKKKYPQLYNVSTVLTYPSSGGNGAFLTYIIINCEQSSNTGVAYVARGGVKQHFIQIIIETAYTKYVKMLNFLNFKYYYLRKFQLLQLRSFLLRYSKLRAEKESNQEGFV